ncbi:Hypothetical protein, putative [Bodo saltans]|uniref:Uncharacterized protein n=1 Tax=Bodo saltans TaxID=75058 RepID=A0A0S4ILV7_BODSA|nr:Hypothetical protein, putative [Bodo saltans]|eukprot:CUE72135.1 Hypothetical protein, putative [Bodo saltans]
MSTHKRNLTDCSIVLMLRCVLRQNKNNNTHTSRDSNENEMLVSKTPATIPSLAADGDLTVQTMRLLCVDTKEPESSFSVFSIPHDGALENVANFVLDALHAPILEEISSMSIFELLKSKYFCAEQ